MSPGAIWTTRASLLLGASSIAVSAAAVELWARVVVHRMASRPRTERSFLEYDAELGWHKAANEEVPLYGEHPPVLFRTNRQGLRGPAAAYEKAPGMTRVLLLGDSFTEAGAVSEESSVRAVLERLLNAQGCGRYEVLNGGTSGYSTDQEYLFFEKEGARYAPDVVVLLFFSNDLQGNTTARKKPWFEADEECRLQLRNSPVPAPPNDRWRRSPDSPADVTPWRGSQALRLLGLCTERANPSLHRALARLGLVAPAADHPPTRDWLLSYGPDSELTDRRWHVTLCLIDALHASVSAHGASFVVFYVPAGFEIDERDWGRTRDRWELDGEGWDAGRVATRLAAACRRWGIPFVDPRPALARARSEGGQAYFAADPHWTDVGHASAAWALAPFVRSLASCGTHVAFTPAPVRK